MEELKVIFDFISIGIIVIITLLFIKYVVIGDLIERNLDKLVALVTGNKKVKK